MGKFKIITHLIMLAITPSLLVYPQNNLPRFNVSNCYESKQNIRKEEPRSLTYDEILDLLDELESGELEKKCSLEDLEQVNQFIAFLAKQGVLSDDLDEEMALEEDVRDLLSDEENSFEYAYSTGDYGEYMILPAVFNGYANHDVLLCKSWLGKKWKKAKKFAKEHKKEIIIGAVIVVAATVVIVAVVAASSAGAAVAAAGAAGTAASSGSGSSNSGSTNSESKESSSSIPDSTHTQTPSHETPILKSALDEQISSFKKNIAREEFFQPSNPSGQELSWEETGRVIGPLFAHESFNNLNSQLLNYPQFSQEIEDIKAQTNFSVPVGSSNNPVDFGHNEIDRRFSADYAPLFSNPGKETDFNALSYQIRGEKALAFGYYDQAVSDLGKAIDINPADPMLYLQRSASYFNMGQYDQSLEDFQQFTAQTDQTPNTNPLSVSEFSLGFAKGLPKGVYESGEGILLFLADFVTHPIHTGAQMVESLSTLANLARTDEWGVIGEALAPEICQLIKEWDTLPSDRRGELAGYAVGKHGGDILVPGALVKVASKSVKSANELAAVCKNIRVANETLVLETAAGVGNSAKIGEIVNAGKTTMALGEELGFTAQEMGQLKKVGKLEGSINDALKNLATKSPSEAYIAAKNGGKHAPLIPQYTGKTVREIQKGIKSYEKQITTHKDKIANPSKYCPDWDKMDPRQQQSLIEVNWPAEIELYTEQRDVLHSILELKQ